jgi:hypothetical protein
MYVFCVFTWLDSKRQLPVPEVLYSDSISNGRSQFKVHTDGWTQVCGAQFSLMAAIQVLTEVDVAQLQ